MSLQVQSQRASTATGPATATRSRTYAWDNQNCAMCTSLGPSRAVDQTREYAGDRWNVVHSLLHSHIGPQQAGDIITKANDISLLSDYRGQKVECLNGDVEAWAVASGLKHDLRVYTSLETEEVHALDGSGYAEATILEVQGKVREDQTEYNQNVGALLDDGKVQEELQWARLVKQIDSA